MMLNNKGSNINHSGMPVHGRLALFCTYARAYHPYVYACACIYMYVYNIHVYKYTGGTRSKSRLRVRMYRTTKHSPDRNQYTVPLHPLLSASPPPPPPSSFAISSAAVYANGAVDTSYDYAVPELGTVPLLNQDGTGRGPPAPPASTATSDQDTIFSKTSSRGNKTENKKVRDIEKCQLTFEWRIVNYVVLLNDEIAETWFDTKTVGFEISFPRFQLVRSIFFLYKIPHGFTGKKFFLWMLRLFFKNSDDWWKYLVDGSRIRISINFWVRV